VEIFPDFFIQLFIHYFIEGVNKKAVKSALQALLPSWGLNVPEE
jgi:hypothetical protein